MKFVWKANGRKPPIITKIAALRVNVLRLSLVAVSLPIINPANIINRLGNDVNIWILVVRSEKLDAIAA